jgi:HSP20 family protein
MKSMKEQLFHNFTQPTNQNYYWHKPVRGVDWAPVDIVEDKTSYTLQADLPGLSSDDIAIEAKEGLLIIKAVRKLAKADGTTTSERREIRLERQFKLPAGILEDKITATIENGVLAVVLPKAKKQNSKKIKVTSV